MYPNLMAAQFLLVLARSALFRLYDAPSVRGGTLLALLGSVIVFYHPVASTYEALLLAAISLSFLPYLLLRDRRRGLALFLSLALLFVISVFYAWDTYDLPQAVGGLLLGGSETGRGERPSVWRSVRSCRSGPGACSRRSRFRCCCWLSWARSSGDGPLEAGRDALRARTGDPVRMVPPPVNRQPDAALRLSPALRARPRHTAGAPRGLRPRGGAAVRGMAQTSDAPRCRPHGGPGVVRCPAQLLRRRRAELAAGDNAPYRRGGRLARGAQRGRQHLGQPAPLEPGPKPHDARHRRLLGAAILRRGANAGAKGSAPYRSRAAARILWVLYHPEGERTQEILEKYDVRYVVLYKNFPNRDPVEYWKLFEAYPDLYRIAFQNRDVVILEPH